MTRWLRAVTGGVVISLLVSWLGFAGACEGLRECTVRLHVLANSDSDEDQALKLRVRDTVTEVAAALLGECDSQAQALATLETALPSLIEAAQQTVYESGYTYPVTAELTEAYFTTRTYDSGTFPAGVYDTLRIRIGAARGRNWWCVVYPPLCVGAAIDRPAATLPQRQTAVTQTSRYAVRFKLVEWWNRWRGASSAHSATH